MFLMEKETGDLYCCSGRFVTMTADWNHDGDIYTDTVMPLYEVGGNGFLKIHRYNMSEYKEIGTEEVRKILGKILEGYFLEGVFRGNYYYTDPTESGIYHYGDYGFVRGGRCVNGSTKEDRQNAIQTELNRIMETCAKW